MVLDLDEAIEAQLVEQASERGVDPKTLAAELLRESLNQEAIESANRRAGIDATLRPGYWAEVPELDEETLERRQKAIDALSTFARDHNISLPPGVTVKDLIEDGRR